MLRYLQGIKVMALAALLFVAKHSIAQTTPQQIKTDVVAHKTIRLLNARQADSIYALAGDAFKQQVTAAQWRQICQTQLGALLPFKPPVFIGSQNAVSKYKLEGKIMLTMNISLDALGKLNDFSFVPYREELKAAPMNEAEKRTDLVARKVLYYLNNRQPDSAYVFAGEKFRKFMDLPAWNNVYEKQVSSMLPLLNPIFTGSKNGVSKYKINQLQFLISLDKAGQFEVLALQPYQEDVTKSEKVANDNPLRIKLDSVVDKYLSKYIQTKGNVGLSAAVYYKGIDHFYNYGETVKDNHKLPDAHTIYEIGSISKTFTATLLAKAVVDGLINLNDPISKYLPDSVALNADLKAITIKHLSNHSSGLPRMPNNINQTVTDLTQPYEHYNEKHLFAFLKSFKATRAPGVTYEYSNLAVSLLGVILEHLYHKPYADLLKLYITQPLQLPETKIYLNELNVKHLAQGYNEANAPVAIWRHQSTQGAGAIKSSAADLLRYGKFQLPGFPNPLSRAFSLSHQSTFDDGINNVGLGWHYIHDEEDPIIQHAGATGGYKAVITVNLKRDMVVVILSNNATSADALGIELTSALIKAFPD